MKRFYWVIIILSWIFILCSCSQQKCEESIGYQYKYRIDLLDSAKYPIDYTFCDTYWIQYPDTNITFIRQECDRGRLVVNKFEWDRNYCLITKLR